METQTTQFVQSCITKLSSGDPGERKAARDEMIGAAAARLRIMAGRMLRDYPAVAEESGDLLAEAYLRLERALQAEGVLEQMRTAEDFFKLAACQIRRELIDLARGSHRRAQRIVSSSGSTSVSGMTPPQHQDSAQGPATLAQRAEFFHAVEQLPDDERTAFELVWIDGLSKVEAAAALGVTEAAIRRRLLKAQGKLFDLFGGEPPF